MSRSKGWNCIRECCTEWGINSEEGAQFGAAKKESDKVYVKCIEFHVTWKEKGKPSKTMMIVCCPAFRFAMFMWFVQLCRQNRQRKKTLVKRQQRQEMCKTFLVIKTCFKDIRRHKKRHRLRKKWWTSQWLKRRAKLLWEWTLRDQRTQSLTKKSIRNREWNQEKKETLPWKVRRKTRKELLVSRKPLLYGICADYVVIFYFCSFS